METANKEWFTGWFDSPWYHLLYQNRDEKEAEGFVASLMQKIPLPGHARVLDLACGKGRHARFVHSLGHQVLGVDLSSNSIQAAKAFEEDGLQFRTGDMREPQDIEAFDLVLNLFTSFGYFESEEDNLRVLDSIRKSLKQGGLLLLDFMNTARVLRNLIPEDTIERGGVTFHLKRFLEKGCIVKSIAFEAGGEQHRYFEKVQTLRREDFFRYFINSGLELVLLSGNYAMDPFEEERSDRMIFLVRKT